MKRVSFRRLFVYSAVVMIMALAACVPDRSQPGVYPDPEWDALRKKGVKYRIAQYTGNHKPDTVYVTEHGAVDAMAMLSPVRRYYDNRNFVKKEFSNREKPRYFIYRYHVRDARYLWKESVEVTARDWGRDGEATEEIHNDTTLLEFDDRGRLIWEIDSAYQYFVKFTYDNDGMLQTQTMQGKSEDSWTTRHTYSYETNGDLKRVVREHILESSPATYYYSHGLLDSLANAHGTVCRYEHVFY